MRKGISPPRRPLQPGEGAAEQRTYDVVSSDDVDTQRYLLDALVGGENALDALREDDVCCLVEALEFSLYVSEETCISVV